MFSSLVLAADTPPPIPTEYWGRLMIDGAPAADGTEVKYYDGSEWITTTTVDGWYNIIMTGGDSPLSYNNDRDCSIHWAAEEACIPCTSDADCIEGPQEGDDVNLVVESSDVPVKWTDDASSGETQINIIPLKTGWNMRSLPSDEINNSVERLISGLSGQVVVWYYDNTGTWLVYDTEAPQPWLNTLTAMEYGKAYWIRSDINQNFGFAGSPAGNTLINLQVGWNFVGFNASDIGLPDAISGLAEPIVVWEYNESGVWKVYDTESPQPWLNTLNKMRQTMGYWIKSAIAQVWEI